MLTTLTTRLEFVDTFQRFSNEKHKQKAQSCKNYEMRMTLRWKCMLNNSKRINKNAIKVDTML
jgi:hypothetical protein